MPSVELRPDESSSDQYWTALGLKGGRICDRCIPRTSRQERHTPIGDQFQRHSWNRLEFVGERWIAQAGDGGGDWADPLIPLHRLDSVNVFPKFSDDCRG